MTTVQHSPYTGAEWQRINALGQLVDAHLETMGVGLTMGGEPTFISRDNFESSQWRTAALGDEKLEIAEQLLQRLGAELSPPGSLLHYGVGKLYPGEDFPRWALGCYWRDDGQPIWHNRALIAEPNQNLGHTQTEAQQFIQTLVRQLGLPQARVLTAYESDDRWGGYALPILPVEHDGQVRWSTCPWQIADPDDDGERGANGNDSRPVHALDQPAQKLYLTPGQAALGLRLPLDRLELVPLAQEAILPLKASAIAPGEQLELATNAIRIALGVEVQAGVVQVFLPPLSSVKSFLELVAAVETTAAALNLPLRLAGYPPPIDAEMTGFQITPDPGVIEVNIHPVAHWQDLANQTQTLYDVAQQCGLGAEKYTLEGQCISTGGGAHITIGGHTPATSPLLRRPDLLRSLISYWQNHPSLSYLFSGLFVGPTSQTPRLDESRHDTLYELEVAFHSLQLGHPCSPELLDSLLGKLLVDASGNAHRTALCIDKLYPQHNPKQQWGLLEFRGFSMPPQASMRILQLLLVRALVARFWQTPDTAPLIRWGTQLYDRFRLPYYLYQDLYTVLTELHEAGYAFELDWFCPFLEFRFPVYGTVVLQDDTGQQLELELRHAIESWPVMGDSAGTAQLVDASMERLQVTLKQPLGNTISEDYSVVCNRCQIPMVTVAPHQQISGIRFRARQFAQLEHPTVSRHHSLVFDVVNRTTGHSLGGCTYYPSLVKVEHNLPRNSTEARDRMAQRFVVHDSRQGVAYTTVPTSSDYPNTLDLRRVTLALAVAKDSLIVNRS